MGLTSTEQKTLDAIVVNSENDPKKPEFPPHAPKFPATPTYRIKVPGLTNVWLKDESVNATGTHKDRMAWEIVVTYKQLLLSKKEGRIAKLPQMSIISSGSAANAIQTALARYNLPNLKVLIDDDLDPTIIKRLEKKGCEIYITDLEKKALSREEILKMTNNKDGIDITSDDSLGPFTVFYDWLSYEVLNQNPEYVFMPYGTGQLFENVINVAVKEVKSFMFHDKRFLGDVKKLRHCNFMGATTNNPKTKADKLYSLHLPFVHFDTYWVQLAVEKGYIGKDTTVQIVGEDYLDQAYQIARKNKVTCEYSGIAGLALLLLMKDSLPKNKKILIVNTGKNKL